MIRTELKEMNAICIAISYAMLSYNASPHHVIWAKPGIKITHKDDLVIEWGGPQSLIQKPVKPL